MSSSLTFQLRQQQQDKVAAVKHLGPAVSLPSPPNSSYGDEASIANADVGPSKEQERRDSLPTHFNALTLQHFSTSLPENYTIEHSSSPIPIQSSSPHSRNNNGNTKLLPQRAESPIYHHLSPTATAAATGGRTIRNSNHGRQKLDTTASSSSSSSSSSSLPNFHSNGAIRKSREGSTGTSTHGGSGKMLHRCEDCGKVYKHPSCLSKHRWEHSDEWELTSKLLLTKHQQVQMLEAAAILVSLDTKRVEQEQARQEQGDHPQQDELPKEQQPHHYLHHHQHHHHHHQHQHQQHGHEIDDDDEKSIRIDDDDGDDTDDDIDMDSISIASSTPSSPDLLPASFPHGDD
ncbi:hypothetical protein BDB00DRAFT_861857 [Zychaea mexicana]|uniref:uncharacterized protein n=1 Tax=Zychaea mexicana TaxID=64656 RepID=UPI0022FEDE9A|nr:uncharacterized protein BDB00DRAFT_861857 [Zychaea mexicana]KAI9471427.1 hypothetical protein BDB00DRAFT_861857 [Zychaea mexicana]